MFKVGDRVWNRIRKQYGEVTSVGDDGATSVRVLYENGARSSYTLDGRYTGGSLRPSIILKKSATSVKPAKKPSYWGLELNGDLLEVFDTLEEANKESKKQGGIIVPLYK